MMREWFPGWLMPGTWHAPDVPQDDVACLRGNLGREAVAAACEAMACGATDFAVALFMSRHAR